MMVVTVAVMLVIVVLDVILREVLDSEALAGSNSWVLADLVHVPQFLIPFLIIWRITRGRIGEYGFTLKIKDAHFRHSRILKISLLIGLAMALRHIIPAIRGEPPDIAQPVTSSSVIGSMTFQWIVVGLTEETMFRGLIQTYLMKNLEGHVELFGHDLHTGTVIGSVFWGLFHFLNLLIMPLAPVIFFVVITTLIGLILGYVYERTGSLLSTIMMHNAIFGVPLTVGYLLYWLL
jgi:membrane protease YdiL (CAAX protease family)